MSIVLVLIIIIAILFAFTYVTRRRFGVLGLALCAGYLLSTMWTSQVTPWVEGAGFDLLTPPLSSVVAATLVLLPPVVLLLFGGPTYNGPFLRLIGAVAFSLLATSFLLGPLGSSLTLDDTGMKIYMFLVSNKSIIITATIGYALYDIAIMRTPKKKG
ncbi:MAG: hypothetical protein H6797_01080 [Candidatus Nomurabacteria bacterium]|nr:MAG: hypothetical protein H6797_01080 [Candidatus Nomurabacteria bacterium]